MLDQSEETRNRTGAWHQSKVSTILDCPRRFGLEYVLELPVRESTWTVTGSAFHAALELHEKARLAGEPVPDRAEMVFFGYDFINTYEDTFTSLELAVMRSELDDALFNFFNYKLDNDLTMHEYVLQFDPMYIESYFKVDLIPGSLPVAGWIDVVYRRDDGSFFIADFKTAKNFSFWNKSTSYINQATFYAAALSASSDFPEITELLPFEFLIMRKDRGKTKQFIGSKIVRCKPTDSDVVDMVNRIVTADSIVEAEEFPLNTGSKFCNEKFCPFFKDCAGAKVTFSEGQLWRRWGEVKETIK